MYRFRILPLSHTLHAHTHTHIQYICVYTHVHTHKHACARTHTHTQGENEKVQTKSQPYSAKCIVSDFTALTHTACTYPHTHTYVHVYIHTQACTCMHTHTHTESNSMVLSFILRFTEQEFNSQLKIHVQLDLNTGYINMATNIQSNLLFRNKLCITNGIIQ